MQGSAAYIELLKLSLLDLLGSETRRAVLQPDGTVEVEVVPEADRGERLLGRDWPADGTTMVGWDRLTNVESCLQAVIAEDIPGDVIETGVWRGGTTIFMRALLKLAGDARQVWVADSFAGLPEPDPGRFPCDTDDIHHTIGFLSVPLEDVKIRFERYGLLDEGVVFLPGWFKDTLPALRDQRWSLIRLDGDMYESTVSALEHLYPNLSPGGFLIVDDFGALPGSRQAVLDFRERHRVQEPIETVDWTGVFWRKQA